MLFQYTISMLHLLSQAHTLSPRHLRQPLCSRPLQLITHNSSFRTLIKCELWIFSFQRSTSRQWKRVWSRLGRSTRYSAPSGVKTSCLTQLSWKECGWILTKMLSHLGIPTPHPTTIPLTSLMPVASLAPSLSPDSPPPKEVCTPVLSTWPSLMYSQICRRSAHFQSEWQWHVSIMVNSKREVINHEQLPSSSYGLHPFFCGRLGRPNQLTCRQGGPKSCSWEISLRPCLQPRIVLLYILSW